MNKKLIKAFLVIGLFSLIYNPIKVRAAITEQQGVDVAEFAKKFIEQGNERRDEKGFPLLTYALSGNWNTCVEIRNKGYNEQLYYIKRNGYYIRNGRYMELGNKWCMDCGTYVTYMLKKTLGLELYNGKEPWHVQDIYNDARKGAKSKYFEFVYSSVSVGRINYSKLQPGDVIARITSGGNHGMLYVGDGMIAHANRDMINYKSPAISGFQVSKLNHYYLSGTVVRVMRIKDGIIPKNLEVNSILTWPDTGETVDLLTGEILMKPSGDELDEISINISGDKIENESGEKIEMLSGDEVETKSGEKIEILSGDEVENESGEQFEIISEDKKTTNIKPKISGRSLFEKVIMLQEKRKENEKIKPVMIHVLGDENKGIYIHLAKKLGKI